MRTYTGKRKPKTKDFDKWKLYFEVSGKNPEDVIDIVAETDVELARWLRDNFIIPLTDWATATIISDFEFINDVEEAEKIEEDREVEPARSDQWYEARGLKPPENLDE